MSKLKIQIKKNDALIVLASSVKLSIKETEQKILSYLKKQNEYISTEACGMSLIEVSEIEGFEIGDLIRTCFFVSSNNTEVNELIESIFVWGFGDCPDCGCDLEIENQAGDGFKWKDKKCTNCEFATSGEPDFDTLPGGYDYNV